MSTHTPEPWTHATHARLDMSSRKFPNTICRVISDEDYTRALACVAACSGMADPAKEIAELRAEVYRIPPGLIEYAYCLPNGQTFKQYAQELEYAFNLLAILHGDGGQYISNHGIKKAVDDAIAKVYALRAEVERLRGLV